MEILKIIIYKKKSEERSELKVKWISYIKAANIQKIHSLRKADGHHFIKMFRQAEKCD